VEVVYAEEKRRQALLKAPAARVVIPHYFVNGGFDLKFEKDPALVDLQGIMPKKQYKRMVYDINSAIKPARATKVDFGLLSLTVVGLLPWAIRHRRRKTRHKKLLLNAITQFIQEHEADRLKLKWFKRPMSQLVLVKLKEGQALHSDSEDEELSD
jgi:hypothetical protein